MDETEAVEEVEEEDDEEVMSEVHVGCPPKYSGPFISYFTFPFPLCTVVENQAHSSEQLRVKDSSNPNLSLDEDGDLVLTRERSDYQRNSICALNIQHSITSSLPSVGLQVWKAALVLTDFVLHKSFTSSDFNGITALELGAGTGVVGITLALVAKKVFITDRGSDILDNCTANVCLNSRLLKYPETSIHVRELDWKEKWPPSEQTNDFESQRSRYSWTPLEIMEAEGATLLLAADVIYSDDLTDAFFGLLKRLMSRGSKKVLYLALEKRYNFSMDELGVVANGHEHFRSFLCDDEECTHLLACFKGEQVDVTQIPQYVREYERGKDVELWKITYCSKC